ncbi:biotin-dependent carboxyltransferase family protein [Psychromonas sp. Urea-02u-13]|uniref:5-oxoprolinase subunit C family protein n=1 Tax=Psychromonas sp. Urea-02u-13 TaxID=2058326 RepID=UPI000C324AFC|nr:biotin-dependent carboxyltransferase family protein [Psychromonas sp. Urea-02u-13]PKG38607.1 hypothetical protein CXF74_12880 [Psychromonas sp. Urea-02u-13]
MRNNAGLQVIKAGLFTQLQDQGRYNQAQQGLSQGGFCDELAAGWANYLLGNSASCPLLEICFGQAEFEATATVQLALTGAPMNAQILYVSGQRQAQKNNCSFVLNKGQRLLLSFATSGVRAYLAIKDGFTVKPILGSVSCVKRNVIGGLNGDGNALKDNDFLPATALTNCAPERKIPCKFIPDYKQSVTLSVIESYQCDAFSMNEKTRFYNSEYHIDKQNDRMGMRLQGPAINGRLSGVVSEGIALGSIQIPADGQPIILLQDRQTLGGYPKIGCVSRCDLSLLAQQSSGKEITFKRTDLATEQLRYLQRLRFFNVSL